MVNIFLDDSEDFLHSFKLFLLFTQGTWTLSSSNKNDYKNEYHCLNHKCVPKNLLSSILLCIHYLQRNCDTEGSIILLKVTQLLCDTAKFRTQARLKRQWIQDTAQFYVLLQNFCYNFYAIEMI